MNCFSENNVNEAQLTSPQTTKYSILILALLVIPELYIIMPQSPCLSTTKSTSNVRNPAMTVRKAQQWKDVLLGVGGKDNSIPQENVLQDTCTLVKDCSDKFSCGILCVKSNRFYRSLYSSTQEVHPVSENSKFMVVWRRC